MLDDSFVSISWSVLSTWREIERSGVPKPWETVREVRSSWRAGKISLLVLLQTCFGGCLLCKLLRVMRMRKRMVLGWVCSKYLIWENMIVGLPLPQHLAVV